MSPRMTWLAGVTIALTACQHPTGPAVAADKPGAAKGAPATTQAKGAAAEGTVVLFDGKTLGNWKATEFGGEGPVEVKDGALVVNAGGTLSGVTWKGPKLPNMNYQIELDAQKLSGSDFFVALTFPYGDTHASLVLGGWGGSTTGISSINGDDAANNETSSARDFKKGQWYHVTLKVTKDRIVAWLDNDKENPVVDLDTENKKIDTRIDIDDAKPLGLSTYQTSAAYKNIVLKKL